MGDILIRAEGITKRYFRKTRESAREFDALANCSVTLSTGELLCVQGRSGSGKSTLLNILAGLLTPTEGTVYFQGDDLYNRSDAELSKLRNTYFGVISQGQTALYSLSVLENVKMARLMYQPGSDCDDRAFELLARLGIEHLSESYPRELSGGELRRVAIARALMNDPLVVFADEPTGDLDDENTELVFDLLREHADAGNAVLLVTHEQTAERVADRTMMP